MPTGYVFPDASSISPYLEDPRTGPTSLFCAELSRRLRCYVAAGYPEALGSDELRSAITVENCEGEEVGANSAILYGPDGTLLGNYRKTNLFETDMTWAKPGGSIIIFYDDSNSHIDIGTGFATYQLSHPIHTMALGICMDLNAQPPALWTLEDGPYEIAQHCIDKKVNVLLLLNAWLDSGREPDDAKDWSTLNFWAARLRPLWARSEEIEEGDEDESTADDYSDGKETIVIVSNRCGSENGEDTIADYPCVRADGIAIGQTFAGTSAIFSLRRGSGRPKLLHSMDRSTQTVEIWHV